MFAAGSKATLEEAKMLIPFTVTRKENHGSFGRGGQCDYTSYHFGTCRSSRKSARTRFLRLDSVARPLSNALEWSVHLSKREMSSNMDKFTSWTLCLVS